MSIKLSLFFNLFLLFLLFSFTKEETAKNNKNSQVKIYSYKNGLLGDPFDDDTDFNTTDKNCNLTEYPEQAKRCNAENMKCEDEDRKHHCSCKEGYITYVDDEVNFKFCNYKQKKQLIAFLLELCVGFGAGHFYRQEYTMASLKLVAFVLGLVFIFSFPITAKCISDCDCDALAIILSIFYYLYLCGLAFWYIWDLVYFGNNDYLDYSYIDVIGQGISLQPW